MIALRDIEAGYRGFRLTARDLAFPAGQVTALIGPNGCGKSTLLRLMSRQLRPARGEVFLEGSDIATLSARALARRVTLLPQENVVPPGITVTDLVGYGRAPHQNLLGLRTSEDRHHVARALSRMQLQGFADREVGALSGGQRQRCFIAMALAQDTPVLLLDEPTNWLDLQHQVQVLRLLRALAAEGRTCIAVLHDIAQAARFADNLVILDRGGIVATGRPGDVLTADLVERVWHLPVEIHADPVTGSPMPVPVERVALSG
ncbi:ABC transporter ATP-binding protein [Marinovum sp.]|uniref:ABC transporter ATP-binding protein n=1 Tax=Marinovum sp. TaxID=2024839 RepID=UPI003A913DB3